MYRRRAIYTAVGPSLCLLLKQQRQQNACRQQQLQPQQQPQQQQQRQQGCGLCSNSLLLQRRKGEGTTRDTRATGVSHCCSNRSSSSSCSTSSNCSSSNCSTSSSVSKEKQRVLCSRDPTRRPLGLWCLSPSGSTSKARDRILSAAASFFIGNGELRKCP